jgi:hypothetical protein
MKIRVQLHELGAQDISSDGDLSIEIDGGVLVVTERKPGRTETSFTHRAVALFAPGIWLAATEITDEG